MANDMSNTPADYDAATASIKATEYAEQNEFEDNRRRVDLEQLAADEYMKHKDNGVSDRLLTRALAVVAAAFYEAGNTYEDRDGVVMTYNDLDFQQKSALGNLCNNAKWLMDSAAQRITQLYTELDQLEATFDGSDNATFAINRVLDQIDRCKDVQIPTLRKYSPITKAVYLAVRGEQWTPPTKKGPSARDQSREATLARLRRAREAQTN